jgi:hypothetical protein
MNRVVVPAHKATKPGGIGSLESIIGLLKCLKIRALASPVPYNDDFRNRRIHAYLWQS